MSGTTPPGSPPPEVPEEFAAAYRAAYERALAEQSSGPQHRDDPTPPDEVEEKDNDHHDTAEQPLPRRRGPLRVGTHRTAQEYDSDRPTWFENIRGSPWFVALLLALLALLLILGAYALGRSFAGRVDSSQAAEWVVENPNGKIQPFTHQQLGKGAWTTKVLRDEHAGAKVSCLRNLVWKLEEDREGLSVAALRQD